jgi:hypothetical protein
VRIIINSRINNTERVEMAIGVPDGWREFEDHVKLYWVECGIEAALGRDVRISSYKEV